eukprot:531116-Hanusia_phi.AAC.3
MRGRKELGRERREERWGGDREREEEEGGVKERWGWKQKHTFPCSIALRNFGMFSSDCKQLRHINSSPPVLSSPISRPRPRPDLRERKVCT